MGGWREQVAARQTTARSLRGREGCVVARRVWWVVDGLLLLLLLLLQPRRQTTAAALGTFA